MTTELEQEFYSTFGIEEKENLNYTEKGFIEHTYNYPEISDHKLLEMLCILNKEAIYGYSDWGGNFVIGETIEELKESILTDCIRNKSKIFNQIQHLFKGEE